MKIMPLWIKKIVLTRKLFIVLCFRLSAQKAELPCRLDKFLNEEK
jgi:hypothetical protein